MEISPEYYYLADPGFHVLAACPLSTLKSRSGWARPWGFSSCRPWWFHPCHHKKSNPTSLIQNRITAYPHGSVNVGGCVIRSRLSHRRVAGVTRFLGTSPMRVYHCPDHVRHSPNHFIARGQVMQCPEEPRRAEILELAAEQAGHKMIAADRHGLAPVRAVHDAGYLTFLEQAWELWSALPMRLNGMACRYYYVG